MRAWGEACCEQFRTVPSATVPPDWRWAEGRHPQQSCPDVAALTLPERTTAHLVGGLRTDSRGNEFLRFALPRLVVRGAPAGVAGFVNNQPMVPLDGDEKGFALPADLAAGPSHWLEVRQGEQVLLRRAVRVSEGCRTTALEVFGRGPTGGSVAATEWRAAGAFLQNSGATGAAPDEVFPRPLPTQLARTLILLGEQPGQVVEWPAEPPPTTWHPVWAVGKVGRDQWEPFFCGTAAHLQAGRPGPALAGSSRRKAWRKATHTERNHTTTPKMKALAQLWKAYQDAGKNL